MTETISYQDIGRLLGLAAARDQRTVGDADILAWHADLNAAHVTFADANAALTRFYAVEMAGLQAEHRRRVTSPDIISIVRKLRAERLKRFIYEPPDPDETGDRYTENLKRQLESTASGHTPAPAMTPALEGDTHPKVAGMLGGIGREVPGEEKKPKVKRPGPFGIECPKCRALVGRPCKTPVGRERRPHPVRFSAAQGAPLPDRAAQEAEIAQRRDISRRYLATQQNTDHHTEGETS